MKTVLAAALLALANAASAAERGYSVTDFDRIRVDGPYRVTLATGRSPGARAFGSAGAIDALSVEVQGRTLVVRRGGQTWGGYPGQSAGPVELWLTGYGLRSAVLNGAGSLSVDRLRGQSINLAVSGSGLLTVGAVEADRLTLAVAGNGRMQVAGKAAAARIVVRGTGAIDARELLVKDAEVAADGPGDIALAASGTAAVASSGAGTIVVTGNAACTVKATGSGEVVCGR